MTIPLEESNPSISERSWFNVCSRSSLPPPYWESRLFPMASISSIKIIHGAICCACLKRSRTREAPTPTNISTKSEPDREKNGTPASPASAFASRVLPVPGGPTSNAPFGSFAPILRYLSGFFKKSTSSCRESFASSSPATSLNVTPVFFSTYIFAVDFPTPMIPPPPPPRDIIRISSQSTIHIPANGRMYANKKLRIPELVSSIFAEKSTLYLFNMSCTSAVSCT